MASLCKSLKLRMLSTAYKVQLDERTRYWWALRRVLSEAHTVATGVDGTRFSKREWQCGPIGSVEAQIFGWQPPAVPDPSSMLRC